MSLILGDSLLRNDKQLQEVLQDKASVSSDQSLSGVNTFTNEIKVGDGLSLKPSFSAPLSDNYNLGTSLTPFNTLFIKDINIDGKNLTDTIDSELEKLDDKFADYVTLATEQTITGVKKFDNAKFPIANGSTDYRYPLTVPATEVTDKRYLIGVSHPTIGEDDAQRQTNAYRSVYMQNGKLYSNDIEVVNVSDSQTLTNKILDGAVNSELTHKLGYCDSAVNSTAKTATLSGYKIGAYTEVIIQFNNGLAHNAGTVTLDINNTGAKPLYNFGASNLTYNSTKSTVLKLLYINGVYYILEDITNKTSEYKTATKGSITFKIEASSTATWNGNTNLVLSNHYVDKYSDQTIQGQKTFSKELVVSQDRGYQGIQIKNTGLSWSNPPTDTTAGMGRWINYGSDGIYMGYVQGTYSTAGVYSLGLRSGYSNAIADIYLDSNNKDSSSIRMSAQSVQPKTDASIPLGKSNYRWSNLYLSGNLSDGTNSTTISNIVTKNTAQEISANKTLTSGAQIKSAGYSSAWFLGRDNAMIVMDGVGSSQYKAINSLKTTNGSWEIGIYTDNAYQDQLIYTYIQDGLIANPTWGTQGTQLAMHKDGSLELPGSVILRSKSITSSSGGKITYNSTTKSIDFTFEG